MKKLILIIFGGLVGLYILFMAAYFATSTPSFCGTCHLVKPYVDSWRSSAHNDVSCLYCHEPRGFLGKLHSKSRGLNYVYQWATNQYTLITNPVVFQQNCIACHLGDYDRYDTSAPRLNNKGTNHYQILKKKTSCFKCHAETGHKNRFYLNPNFEKLWK